MSSAQVSQRNHNFAVCPLPCIFALYPALRYVASSVFSICREVLVDAYNAVSQMQRASP